MTPSTLVRAIQTPKLPFTFTAMSALFAEERKPSPRSSYHKCVAAQDDGSVCAMPARYVDMKRGGHVCYDHRPDRKQEVLRIEDCRLAIAD